MPRMIASLRSRRSTKLSHPIGRRDLRLLQPIAARVLIKIDAGIDGLINVVNAETLWKLAVCLREIEAVPALIENLEEKTQLHE